MENLQFIPVPVAPITQAVQIGIVSLRERSQRADSENDERLYKRRAALTNFLPADIWVALGVNPLELLPGGDTITLRAESAVNVMGEVIKVTLSLDPHGTFYVLGEAIASMRDRAVDAEAARQRFGEALLQAYWKRKREQTSKREQEIARFERQLENTRMSADLIRETAIDAEDSAFLSPAEKAKILRRLAVHLNGWRKRRHAERREQRAKIADAELVMTLAFEHANLVGDYDKACRRWAEVETKRLWRPWGYWRVQHTSAAVNVVDGETEYEMVSPYTQVIQEIVTLDEPTAFGEHGLAQELWKAQRIDEKGGLHDFRFPWLLSAERVEVAEVGIDRAVDYHRHYEGGAYTVNVPPHFTAVPSDPPAQRPAYWAEWVAERLGDRKLTVRVAGVGYGDWQHRSSAEIAELSAEEYVREYGNL